MACLGGGKSDAAKELREAEAKRTRAIQQGQGKIKEAFAGYDPTFYQGVQKNVLNQLMPQADRQYRAQRKNLAFGLSDRGLFKSSFGKEAGTELERSREVAEQSVINQSLEAVRETKGRVHQEQANVTNQLVTSQDPNLAAQQAISAAASISAPSPIAPLGDLFQTFANSYMGYNYGKLYPTSAGGGGGGQTSWGGWGKYPGTPSFAGGTNTEG